MAFGNATKGYVKKHSGGGGGGGTSNYDDLSNKPSINGVTLSGNKTSEDLGISGGGGGFGNLTLIKNNIPQLDNIAIDINNINGIVFVKNDTGSKDFYIVPKELIQLVPVDAQHSFRHDFSSSNYIEVLAWSNSGVYTLQFDIRFASGVTLSLYKY